MIIKIGIIFAQTLMQDSAIFVAVDIVVFRRLIDQAHTDIGTMIGDSFIVRKGLDVRKPTTTRY